MIVLKHAKSVYSTSKYYPYKIKGKADVTFTSKNDFLREKLILNCMKNFTS